MSDWPFTPEAPTGGWHVSQEDEFGGYLIQEEQEAWRVSDSRRGWQAATKGFIAASSANVNLIAAAPRMYRALKTLLAESDKGGTEWQPAREVIEWIDNR